jgi:glycosyltransferase involved in cell wall biosynthesis
MDLVIVSCEHAKRVFEETKYNIQDNKTGQITGTVALQTKVEVLFEGADITKYGPLHLPTTLQLDEIDEQFAFLTIGHWLPGEVGQDRKNIGYTIKSFLETFKNKPKDKRPALVLKVQAGSATSIMDRDTLLDKIDSIRKTVKGDLPNIYIVHGDLSETEVNELYNHGKIKAMISLTKGEGFGRPLLEFSLVNKPIICSGWSGQVDYLSPEFVKMIGGTLENIHPSAVVPNMLLPESKWFTPDPMQVGRALEDVYKNYSTYKELAKRQGHKSRTQFSYDKMREMVDTLLTQYIPIFPEQVPLQLPVLKRIQLPKI